MLAGHQHSLNVLPEVGHAHSRQPYEGGAMIEPILEMKTLRIRGGNL